MEWSISRWPDFNPAPLEVLHLDLNSCFASIEQQANPLLRGKSVVVAAYTSPGGCIVAASIEAKRKGIHTGMRVFEAKQYDRSVVVLPPDPPKYRDVHQRMLTIFLRFTPKVIPKSIDEAILEFSKTPASKRDLQEVALEIKQAIYQEIGEWIRCSIGISTNHFLAKTAASLHKPDGLDIIQAENIVQIFSSLQLTDLCGINTGLATRLKVAQIFTPLDFLRASPETLKKQVFHGVWGWYWYRQLRGYEIDGPKSPKQGLSQSYALPIPTQDYFKLKHLIFELTEKMARRLRAADLATQAISLAFYFKNAHPLSSHKKIDHPILATKEIYQALVDILDQQGWSEEVIKVVIGCSKFTVSPEKQASLFSDSKNKNWQLAKTLDIINNRYGEYTIVPAAIMGLENEIIDRISFGN
jgi:DNA polymerase-4